ncbi:MULTISPECIES: DUF975 family protein [Enterococcus]|nr:DUF975 family protein [Enterococcus faecium]EGP4892437.1 DUF975 family protein [Enterococcus faecium]EGP4915394.1 DUF975 family protein [Enterococcus faecium]EGP5559777.1 DUF975 family protein [Enterococcus faecium]EME3542258.1 DUF975 family protein [Enterococcus faecium]EME3574937.1 DUF975 family protein [Enterococcus faecium]
MLSSKELKLQAKNCLRGRWEEAVMLSLIPSILVVSIILLIVPGLWWYAYAHNETVDLIDVLTQLNNNSGLGIASEIFGSMFMAGISWTYLDLFRQEKKKIEPLKDSFQAFSSNLFSGIFLLSCAVLLFTNLWSLLLIIPGIIKYYSYAQSYFIYYDIYKETGKKPKILDAITASRKLMVGNKGNLFWLDLTFIGWHCLALLTLGIGYLWLNPYITATKAAFYYELKKEWTLC